MLRKNRCLWIATLLAVLALAPNARAQHGPIFNGGGPVNRSFGGASTATALDSLGAFYWNPAGISALECSEMTFGAEFLWPRAELSSRVTVPPFTFAGSSSSDSGTSLLPTVGLVHHVPDTSLSLGLGMITAAGFAVNYPASLTNPIVTPPPPVGLGVGKVYTDVQVFQLVPTASVQVTDRLAVGVSPIINMAFLRASPLLQGPPDDANGDGFFTFPDGSGSQMHWGAGFQIGAFYAGPGGWNFGVSFKSPQWFETFRFNTVNEIGLPRRDNARFDLPWIGSVGAAYTGFERWVLAADVRYIDYRNTEGFDDASFTPFGAVRGLGWDSQIAVALGAQYEVGPRLKVRGGYSFNNNPQDSAVAALNIGSPTIIEHVVYTGFTWSMSEALHFSLAYLHGFENSVSGPLVAFPGVPIPGTQVQSKISADAVVLGFSVRY